MVPVSPSIDAAADGAILATAIRWFFGFQIELHWVAAIGAFSEVTGKWAIQHFGAALSAWPEPVVAGVLGTILLAGAQLVSSK